MDMEERDAKIIQLRSEKKSHTEIAATLNVPSTVVRYVLVHKNMIKGRATDDTRSPFWQEHTPKLIELYTTTNLTTPEIARQLGSTTAACSGQIWRLAEAGVIQRRAKEVKSPVGKPATVIYDLSPKLPPKPLPASVMQHFAPQPAKPSLEAVAGCRWPFDPVDAGSSYTFCGCRIAPNATLPYCSLHSTLSRRASPVCDPVAP